jgi:OTU domain-containing protein 6
LSKTKFCLNDKKTRFSVEQRDPAESRTDALSSGLEAVQIEPRRVSKAEKRREKKAKEQREINEKIAAAEAESVNADRCVEERALADLLQSRGLKRFSVPPDGDW